MKAKELEILLEKLKPIEKPKVWLEQYTIPSRLAAQVLNLASLCGDIKDKKIFDLGCGSGRLSIGASILGAKKVFGFDKDEDVIKIAKENLKFASKLTEKKLKVNFLIKDIREIKEKCDVVIQNPPFGIKSLESDILFLEKAMQISKKVYSLHRDGRERTRNFLKKFIKSKEGKIERIVEFDFLLHPIFKFHKKPKVRYKVDLYVIDC